MPDHERRISKGGQNPPKPTTARPPALGGSGSTSGWLPRNYVDIDADRRGGVPVLKGTRITISQLFAQLAEGDSVGSIAAELDLEESMLCDLLHALSVAVGQQKNSGWLPEPDGAGWWWYAYRTMLEIHYVYTSGNEWLYDDGRLCDYRKGQWHRATLPPLPQSQTTPKVK